MASKSVVEGVRPLEQGAGHEHGQAQQQVVELVPSGAHQLTVALAEKIARARAVRRAAGLSESLDNTSTIARLAGLLSPLNDGYAGGEK